eukprot:scaffold6562_cov163-Amphora_coffeaeformis.AAC.14
MNTIASDSSIEHNELATEASIPQRGIIHSADFGDPCFDQFLEVFLAPRGKLGVAFGRGYSDTQGLFHNAK